MFSENTQTLIINNLGISGLISLIVFFGFIYIILKIKVVWARLVLFLALLVFAYFLISSVTKTQDYQPKTTQIKENSHCFLTNVFTGVWIRKEPKIVNYNKIESLLSQSNITILKASKELDKNHKYILWYKISYTNKKNKNIIGWIKGRYLTTEYGKYRLKNTITKAKVHSNPRKNSETIEYITNNDKYIIATKEYINKETLTRWLYIKYANNNNYIKGWISNKVLEKESRLN